MEKEFKLAERNYVIVDVVLHSSLQSQLPVAFIWFFAQFFDPPLFMRACTRAQVFLHLPPTEAAVPKIATFFAHIVNRISAANANG